MCVNNRRRDRARERLIETRLHPPLNSYAVEPAVLLIIDTGEASGDKHSHTHTHTSRSQRNTTTGCVLTHTVLWPCRELNILTIKIKLSNKTTDHHDLFLQ